MPNLYNLVIKLLILFIQFVLKTHLLFITKFRICSQINLTILFLSQLFQSILH